MCMMHIGLVATQLLVTRVRNKSENRKACRIRDIMVTDDAQPGPTDCGSRAILNHTELMNLGREEKG